MSLSHRLIAVMLACISPAGTQAAETKCTLEFASRATQIVNKASKNEVETLGGTINTSTQTSMYIYMYIFRIFIAYLVSPFLRFYIEFLT